MYPEEDAVEQKSLEESANEGIRRFQSESFLLLSSLLLRFSLLDSIPLVIVSHTISLLVY